VLAYNLDDFLTHNYKILKSTKKFLFSGEKTWKIYGDTEMVTSQVWSETLGRYWNNRTYVMRPWAQYTMKYFKTPDEAIAYIAVASHTVPPNKGSYWAHTGEFEYVGVKIINSATEITHYDYDEPLS
jgi:hypothetical protein